MKRARVLVVGAGGLGSPVLLYLAGAGIGTLGIVDFDQVDVSNLQRQVLHNTAGVGTSKVDSAVERLRALNPLVHVQAHPVALDATNALELVGAYDLVIDGTDNFRTRYLVNDACEILGKPLIYGSIHRFEGQASVFNLAGGPTYRDLYPEPPDPGTVPNCSEAGVLGVLPGLIGLVQATEVLKIVLGIGETLSGRLLLVDALSMRFQELSLARDPHRAPVHTLVENPEFCGGTPMSEPFTRIDVHEAKRRLDEGWKPFVLDVRKPNEAEISKFDFMDRLHPHETVLSIASELPRDRDILVTCRSGGRSAMACQMLASQGFDRLTNLEGGINGWARDIDPSLTVY